MSYSESELKLNATATDLRESLRKERAKTKELAVQLFIAAGRFDTHALPMLAKDTRDQLAKAMDEKPRPKKQRGATKAQLEHRAKMLAEAVSRPRCEDCGHPAREHDSGKDCQAELDALAEDTVIAKDSPLHPDNWTMTTYKKPEVGK